MRSDLAGGIHKSDLFLSFFEIHTGIFFRWEGMIWSRLRSDRSSFCKDCDRAWLSIVTKDRDRIGSGWWKKGSSNTLDHGSAIDRCCNPPSPQKESPSDICNYLNGAPELTLNMIIVKPFFRNVEFSLHRLQRWRPIGKVLIFI